MNSGNFTRLLLWNLGVMAAGAAILVQPESASAANPLEEPRATIVRIDDLDLDSATGQRRLERRIGRAARWVCGFDRIIRRSVEKCMTDAKQNAHAQLLQRVSVQKEHDIPQSEPSRDLYSR